MAIYCFNLCCEKPLNPDSAEFCQNCGTKLISLLRNRYHVIQPLGGGGFGRTFLAEDEDKLKEHCVVKQLAPQVQGTSALQKATELFQEEARRLQQLGEHPQIPTLYAYFRQENYLYLVQQFIEGQTLRQELNQHGLFCEEKIWEVLGELLPILKFIHEHQVIHRDIKPENIIRRLSPKRKGNLVLIDFGVAKQLTENSLEKTGTTIGSYGYAPMEQMKYGSAHPASDLFSLGVTCFYLLTGVHPSQLYIEDGYSWVAQWQQHLRFSISTQLERVLDKLLQKNLENRYQSADEVLQDCCGKPKLETIPQEIADTLISTNPKNLSIYPSTVIQPKIQIKKHTLLGSFAVFIMGLGGFLYWQNQRNTPTLIGHLGDINSLAVKINIAPFDKQNSTELLASGSDDKTIKIWDLNKIKEIRTLKGHKEFVYSVALSADGQTLASGSKDNTIKIWNVNKGEEIRTLIGHSSYVNSVAMSADSQTLISGSYDKTIKVWNLKTGQEIHTLKGHEGEVLSVAISPDGQTIASGSTDRTVKIWNVKTGQLLRTLNGHLGDVNAVAISPERRIVASVSDDRTIRVWNLNTGRELRPPLTGHSADVNAVAFSPDSEKIATGSDDTTVKLWNLSTGQEIKTFKGHSQEVFAVVFSQDGKKIVSGSKDKTIKIWQVP
ncbi:MULTISPECIES: serine/threonine-protein kinase [Nostocales]|uniref:Protein kinase n=3 Tax=Nostocales TaxID=1161 RepID=A0A0C1N5B9_9CYAN|nr:serine/threonine-protein kinase [Tolypothrix bouteillei]KAF3888839.1 protein kinase [Tolypothrix bouteillei VB521301]